MTVDDVVARIGRDGYAVVPDVLSPAQVSDTVDRLWRASAEGERRGLRSHVDTLDPNDRNVRVWDLVGLDPIFGELLQHPLAEAIVSRELGRSYIVSNFTANIARPGSGSMAFHSDQAAVVPEPWVEPWAINIIWCLCDVRRENGATLHLPGSQHITSFADIPKDLDGRLVPLEARAGSIIAMAGRVWHTSGCNVTTDEDRPLLFAYYTKPFVRPQWNFAASLAPDVQARFSPAMRRRLGLDLWLNVPQ